MSALTTENKRFLWHSTLLVKTGFITSFLYLMVHPVLGRYLDEIDYAIFVSLMGLLSVLALPAVTIRSVMARYTAEYAQPEDEAVRMTIIRRAIRKVSLLGSVGLVLWCAASYPLKLFLEVPSAWALVVVGVVALLRLYAPVMQGALQGSSFFVWLSAAALAGASLRVLLTYLSAVIGGGVTGAVVAVAVSAGAALVLCSWPFLRLMKQTPLLDSFSTRPIYRYMLPVLLGQGALFLLMNLDLILAPRLLDDKSLSVYAKAATLARISLFAAAPVATVMFPRAVASSRIWVLLGPALLTLLLALLAAVVLAVHPGFFMNIIYGTRDVQYDTIIRIYVWAALPMSLCSMLCQYLWARHRAWLTVSLIPVTLAYGALICVMHDNSRELASAVTYGSWLALSVLLVVTAIGARGEKAKPE